MELIDVHECVLVNEKVQLFEQVRRQPVQEILFLLVVFGHAIPKRLPQLSVELKRNLILLVYAVKNLHLLV